MITCPNNIYSLVSLRGASPLTSSRATWCRSGGSLFIGGLNTSRYYGCPSGYSPANGTSFIPPEKTGGMTSRLAVTATPEADMMYSDLLCEPEFWANLMGYGSLASDLSIGSRPSAEDIAYALMDTPVGYIGDISLRQALLFIKQIEQGRWKIVNNQMIFYDNDNVTPIRTFDLKNQQGQPTMQGVFERTPVT